MPTITLNDCQLSYHDYGDDVSSGVPLLLLHSELLTHATWRLQINAFANRFRVITVDLRGHGESCVNAASPYTIHGFAQDMMALMDALMVERMMVCGHALGGMVAQEMAILYPDRVDALVLANTPFTSRLSFTETVSESVTSVLSPFVGMHQRLMWRSGIRGDVHDNMRDVVNREMARHARSLDNVQNIENAMQSFDNSERLQEIQCLTLILTGEHSHKSLTRQARHMTSAIRGSFYGLVLSAGQMLHWDNAALFNGITLEFLDGAAALNA